MKISGLINSFNFNIFDVFQSMAVTLIDAMLTRKFSLQMLNLESHPKRQT
jgi:hypothetical protein